MVKLMTLHESFPFLLREERSKLGSALAKTGIRPVKKMKVKLDNYTFWVNCYKQEDYEAIKAVLIQISKT